MLDFAFSPSQVSKDLKFVRTYGRTAADLIELIKDEAKSSVALDGETQSSWWDGIHDGDIRRLGTAGAARKAFLLYGERRSKRGASS